MKLTTKERLLLKAVRDSEYQDGENPVDRDIWLDYIVDTKSRGGVLTQLVRKGLVRINIVPKRESANRTAGISDSTIAMTQAGFDALSTHVEPQTVWEHELGTAHCLPTHELLLRKAAIEAELKQRREQKGVTV